MAAAAAVPSVLASRERRSSAGRGPRRSWLRRLGVRRQRRTRSRSQRYPFRAGLDLRRRDLSVLRDSSARRPLLAACDRDADRPALVHSLREERIGDLDRLLSDGRGQVRHRRRMTERRPGHPGLLLRHPVPARWRCRGTPTERASPRCANALRRRHRPGSHFGGGAYPLPSTPAIALTEVRCAGATSLEIAASVASPPTPPRPPPFPVRGVPGASECHCRRRPLHRGSPMATGTRAAPPRMHARRKRGRRCGPIAISRERRTWMPRPCGCGPAAVAKATTPAHGLRPLDVDLPRGVRSRRKDQAGMVHLRRREFLGHALQGRATSPTR